MKQKSQNNSKTSDEEVKLSKIELNITEILTEISNQNEDIEFNQEDPFAKENPSKVTLQYLFYRIKKYSQIEKSTLIFILIYADRICVTAGIILNPHNIHRIILGCWILAIKYNEDVFFNNEFYAKVGGVAVEELNRLEYESFKWLNNELFVSEDIYQKYKTYITHYSDEQS